MADDTLRMAAELAIEKFSGPAKEMLKAMRELRDAAKDTHGAGVKDANKHSKAYAELEASIGNTAGRIGGVLSPAMAALGITGFSAGAALTKVVENLKLAADSYHVLNDAERRSGLSADKISAVSIAFERLGQAPAAAMQSLANFGEHMDRIGRLRPDEITAWTSAYSGLYETLGKDLQGKSRTGQLEEVFKWLTEHKDIAIDKKRDVLDLIGLDKSLATKSGEELRDALMAGLNYQKDHPDNAVLNKALQKSFADLTDASRGFGWQMNETFGPGMIRVLDGFSAVFGRLSAIVKEFSSGTIITPGTPLDRLLHWNERANADLEKSTRKEVDDNKQQKLMNDRGQLAERFRAGVIPMAFHSGGGAGSGDSENILTRSVKTGMLEAFREWFSSLQTPGGGGGGGYQNASYGASGGNARGGAAFGNSEYPAVGGGGDSPSVGGRDSGSGASAPPTVGRGSSIATPGGMNNAAVSAPGGINREKWLAELESNPRLKEELYRRSLGENSNPMANQAVMETAANRADIRGGRSFGDKGNLKYFQGYHGGRITDKQRAMLDANYDKVFRQGSDVSYGAIDNSSQWLSSKHERNGRFRTTANYGGDGITGHRGVESFQVPGWGESGGGERSRYPAYRAAQLAEAERRYAARTGTPSFDDRFGAAFPNSKNSLLYSAKQSGLAGGGQQTIKGDAALKIDLNGFPSRTKTDLTYGGLFTQYELNRGKQMETASETQ